MPMSHLFKAVLAALALVLALGLSLVAPSSATAAEPKINSKLTAMNDPKLPAKYRVRASDTQAQRLAKANAYSRSPEYRQLTAGGAIIFYSSADSNRVIRVFKSSNCPNGGASDLVYENERAAFLGVDSMYQGPWRQSFQTYWIIWTTTKSTGKCVNILPSPTTVVKMRYHRT